MGVVSFIWSIRRKRARINKTDKNAKGQGYGGKEMNEKEQLMRYRKMQLAIQERFNDTVYL